LRFSHCAAIVLDCGGEGQGPNACRVAVEGDHIVAPRCPILKDEDLALAFRAKVEQFVAGATQEAGEIELAGLEPMFGLFGSFVTVCPVDN
jgi:hypothetical protein